MRSLIFTIIIFFACPCILSAQSAIISNHSLSINLFGADYSYEQRLKGGFSLIARVGFDNIQGFVCTKGYSDSSYPDPYVDYKGDEWDMGFAFAVEPRFYYNTGRRANHGKNTLFNSFDFVALEFRAVSNPVNRDHDAYRPFRAGAMWGMRRVYGKHWLVEGNAGINVYQNTYDDFEFGPRLNVRFGFVF